MNLYAYFCFLSALAVIIGFVTRKLSDTMDQTIAISATTMIVSMIILLLGYFNLFHLEYISEQFLNKINFKSFLLDGILGFLLFAGSLQIKLPLLKSQKYEIAVFAIISTLLSTLIIGFATYYLAHYIGLEIDLIYTMLFGALISPTDPIAVLAILKNLKAPKKLSIQIEGESLFNDGVGLVIFVTIFAIAFGGETADPASISTLFVREAGGGIVYGLIIGIIAHYLISATDDGSLEILLTSTIPSAGFMFAIHYLEVSGALAMVVSGIFIGNITRKSGFSEQSLRYLDEFWEIIDHLLNSLVFLLIGFALLLIHFNHINFIMMFIAIPVCLIARYLSLLLPYSLFKIKRNYNRYTLSVMTWGGLRGGLALAMALSIPPQSAFVMDIDVRDLLLLMTYAVVMFSILVQGLTVDRLIKKAKVAEGEPDR